MRKYKLLSLDMDGTLLDSKTKVSPETVETLVDLTQKGVNVVLGTGRGLAELRDYKREFRGIRYGILMNGGMLYDFFEEKVLFLIPLKLDYIMEILQISQEERGMLQVQNSCDTAMLEDDILNMSNFQMKLYQEMYERVAFRVHDFEKFIRENASEISKMGVYCRSAESRDRSYERVKKLDVNVTLAGSISSQRE